MAIDLQGLRKRINFTQAEMALELGVKTGTYAMMERGTRKIPPAVEQSFKKLQLNLSGTSTGVVLRNFTESADVAALLERAQLTATNVQEQIAWCVMEIFGIQNKLRAMKRRFNKALEFVNSADIQLQGMPDEKNDMYKILRYKRRKAMESMEEIIAQNPAKLMVKIEVLKQEKIIFENALQAGKTKWLDQQEANWSGE